MPIYEFLCEGCGYQEDLMRKISEPAKTDAQNVAVKTLLNKCQLQILN